MLRPLAIDILEFLAPIAGGVLAFFAGRYNSRWPKAIRWGNISLAMHQEIVPAQIPAFVATHGMPGFAPTQGHIASAVPFLGHAVDGLRDGSLQRVMLLAKGSLFLGRMTQLADGMSFLLERNV